MRSRLTSAVLVSALIRRVEASGGHAMVLVRGDATAGVILLALVDRGRTMALVESIFGMDGYELVRTGPDDLDAPGVMADYVARRCARDPDLWVVELDTPDAYAIAREVLG